MFLRRFCGLALSCFLVVSCGPKQSTHKSTLNVGPQDASVYTSSGSLKVAGNEQSLPVKLSVIVPVFDHGMTEDQENYNIPEGEEILTIWPELRYAEANRFAFALAQELDKTSVFGSVRVSPDSVASGELYVLGRIVESNGSEVTINVRLLDVSNKKWLDENFQHEVNPGFYKSHRKRDTDAYAPLFKKVSQRIVEVLSKSTRGELRSLPDITQLRYASSMASGALAEHLKFEGNRYSLISLPDVSDPMLMRSNAIRVREQLFLDDLQDNYAAFSSKIDKSYYVWQEASNSASIAQKKAEADAMKKIFGALLAIGLGVGGAVAAGNNSDNYAARSLGLASLGAGVIAGAALLQSASQSQDEAKLHAETISELGESLDLEVAPKVIEFGETQVKLQGTAREQFAQWRAHVQKIFAAEQTPDTQL
ncbi:MAG: hypothetical protein ACYYK0_01825 [Candidatus Eutrophobiaceae bacterium]